MKGRWYIAVFGGLLVLALLATWPLRLAGLESAGITASAVTGTIWHGRLRDAAVGGVPIGDVEAGLAALPLLGGRLQMNVASAGLQGAVSRRINGFGITGLNGGIGPFAIAGMPIDGADFAGVDIELRDGMCVRAAGQVQVRAGTEVLAGAARCDGDAAVLTLASATEKIRFDMRIDAARRYRAVLEIDGASEAERAALLASGFQPTVSGVSRVMAGGL